jgi:CelD/BcsL family acetyltransferase involved in cellulose biosynthesis
MRHQAERGVTLFDHLTGVTTFKERFATDQAVVEGVRVVRLGLRTRMASAAHWLRRVARRLVRPFRKSPKPEGRPVLSSPPVQGDSRLPLQQGVHPVG